MIGTTAAILGLMAAQGASAAMNHVQQNKAKKTQTSAIQGAQNALASVYQQQQQLQAPWYNAGSQSMNLLGALMTPQGSPGAYKQGADYRMMPQLVTNLGGRTSAGPLVPLNPTTYNPNPNPWVARSAMKNSTNAPSLGGMMLGGQ